MKLDIWENPEQVISQRLEDCKAAKKEVEYRWDKIDKTLYEKSGYFNSGEGDNELTPEVVYAFKNLRFIHSQLASNPPVVNPRPTSTDTSDLDAADAADSLIKYGFRQYALQNWFDLVGLDCVQYGTGILKTAWDPTCGDIIDFNEETDEYVLEGDFSCSKVSPRDFFIDPDANCNPEIRFVFQRYYVPFDEAVFKLGRGNPEVLKKLEGYKTDGVAGDDQRPEHKHKKDIIEIYEYWETGLASNGYAGRYAVCGPDGRLLCEVKKNPHEFNVPGSGRKWTRARLPFHIFTDIDRSDSVWGLSFLDFAIGPQDTLNKLDSYVLEGLEANAVFRLILPEGTEVQDDSITTSSYDIVKITGSQPPHFISPPMMPPDLSNYRALIKEGIDELSGVNESMFGQQSRETAGYAMQYAVNQGSMVRKRLFNKYAMLSEAVWKDFLDIVRTKWVTPRIVSVLGQEKAMQTREIQGADIDGGFDLSVEYGSALAIDPITRRQEILQLQPLFEKAGVPQKTSLKLLRLSELSELFDASELAERKQKKYFDRIITTEKYVPPGLFEDHENMLMAARDYIMREEFDSLDVEIQDFIRKHIVDRAGMPAAEQELLSGLGKTPPVEAAPAGGLEALVGAGGAPVEGGVPPVGELPVEGELPPLGL